MSEKRWHKVSVWWGEIQIGDRTKRFTYLVRKEKIKRLTAVEKLELDLLREEAKEIIKELEILCKEQEVIHNLNISTHESGTKTSLTHY